MAKARGGRPSKLTPEVQQKIVTAIRAGNSPQDAAVYAANTERTFDRWIARGEKAPAGPYPRFWEAVKAAESEAEVRAVAIIQQSMPANWRAAMTYLERKYPRRWGRQLDITTDTEMNDIITAIGDAGERAKEAGDTAGVEAAIAALHRIGIGEDVRAVHADWLAAR